MSFGVVGAGVSAGVGFCVVSFVGFGGGGEGVGAEDFEGGGGDGEGEGEEGEAVEGVSSLGFRCWRCGEVFSYLSARRRSCGLNIAMKCLKTRVDTERDVYIHDQRDD